MLVSMIFPDERIERSKKQSCGLVHNDVRSILVIEWEESIYYIYYSLTYSLNLTKIV